MSRPLKAQRLLEVAGKTLDNGDRETAKEMVVLAMKQDDSIEALDRLLPSVPEPPVEVEEETLSESQVAKILGLVKELEQMKKFKIVNQILAKVEKIEEKKRRKKKA
jgi:hypothetical protein